VANATITAPDILMAATKYLQTWRYFLETKNRHCNGTPPGTNYAKLYYGTWEIEFRKHYLKNLALYC
jgi:hypothetical protein